MTNELSDSSHFLKVGVLSDFYKFIGSTYLFLFDKDFRLNIKKERAKRKADRIDKIRFKRYYALAKEDKNSQKELPRYWIKLQEHEQIRWLKEKLNKDYLEGFIKNEL